MSGTVFGRYLEAEVLHADPVKLVDLLYRGAAEAIAEARRHLKSGEIRQRSRRITQAYEILDELARSLDHQNGAEISRNLESLYRYMQGRLLEANSKQTEPPLVEVERLLATLREAWKAIPTPQQVPKIAVEGAHLPYSEIGPWDPEYTPVNCSY